MNSLLTVRKACDLNRRLSLTFIVTLAIVVTLTATSSAEAAGFNVNSNVTFTPLASTYRTSTNTTGCPAGFAGKFTFTAALTNKPNSAAMPGVTVRVMTLTNGNVLLDPQTNAVLGGVGAEMTVPKVGLYADGLLSAGESVDVPFVLCLKTSQPFQFFVDVFGVITQLVSINQAGTDSGSNRSYGPTISRDGRFIAFGSAANDLAANDNTPRNTTFQGPDDVFVRDVQAGTTTLVSVNLTGASGNGLSGGGKISANGRFVAFDSNATDLTVYDNEGQQQVYVRDLQLGTTTLVSFNRFGTTAANFETDLSDISADGRFVLFESFASDLTANQTVGGNAFVRDLQTGTTQLVVVDRNGLGTKTDNRPRLRPDFDPSLSADGRFVVFVSAANDLVANDTNGTIDVFVRDLQAGTTTLVSINRTGTDSGKGGTFGSILPTISADGRFVVFSSDASDLVANDTNGNGFDVFVRDLQAGTTTLLGSGSMNDHASISADNRFIEFISAGERVRLRFTDGRHDACQRESIWNGQWHLRRRPDQRGRPHRGVSL